MAFEGLFGDEKKIKVVDSVSLGYLSLKHNRLDQLSGIDDLIKYLRCMWAFIAFIRPHKELKLAKSLVFNAGNYSCNCYWWSVLYYTNRLGDLVLAEKPPTDFVADKKVASIQDALSLTWRMMEVEWVDRSDSGDFQAEVEEQTKKLKVNYNSLRFRMLCVGAAYRDKTGEHEKASKMYAMASELDKKDRNVWAQALLSKSMACRDFAEYGESIVWAKEYERFLPGAVHPDLKEWLTENGTKVLPANIKVDQLELHDVYVKGTPSKKDPILYSHD